MALVFSNDDRDVDAGRAVVGTIGDSDERRERERDTTMESLWLEVISLEGESVRDIEDVLSLIRVKDLLRRGFGRLDKLSICS